MSPGVKREMKSLDVRFLSEVMQELLIEAAVEVVIMDAARNKKVVIPYVAAAADGLLPIFFLVGEAIWSDMTEGDGFAMALTRDLGALLSWRIDGLGAQGVTPAMLCTKEALAQATTAEGIMVADPSRIFDESLARRAARRARAAEHPGREQ